MFDGGAGGSKSNIYLTNLNWRDIYAAAAFEQRSAWVDIKLCHWVLKVPFVMRRIDFTIVYFYLKYEK